jgi:PAS domain S-box-containing protein
MAKHTTMSIPKALYDSVKEIIDSIPELGYTTPAEFCKDAIRRRISSIKKEYQIDKKDIEYVIGEIKKTMDYDDYKFIFDSLNWGLAVFSNPDGSLISCNKKFLEILEYAEDDVQLKKFYDFVVPEDVSRVKKCFRAGVEGKEIENLCVVRVYNGKGEIVSVNVDCGLYKVGEHIKGVSVLVRKVDDDM